MTAVLRRASGSPPSPRPRRLAARLAWSIYPLLLLAFGAALLLGGVKLIVLGGSGYYACAGAATVAAGALLFRRNRVGAWLFAATTAATIVWAIVEAGPDPWALLPRVWLVIAFAAWLPTPALQRGLRSSPAPLLPRPGWRAIGVTALAALLALAGIMRWLTGAPGYPPRTEVAWPAAADLDWPAYGGSRLAQRHSALAQITAANVGRLRPAWLVRDGMNPALMAKAGAEATPIAVGGLLYSCAGDGSAFAIDAATGRTVWRATVGPRAATALALVCRGVSYARVAPTGECATRIFYGTAEGLLYARDAPTGRLCAGFGNNGIVDLTGGLGDVPTGSYTITSPPAVVAGRVVIGAAIADNLAVDMPSGVIRAFDTVTGRLAWAWDMGEPANSAGPSPGRAYTRSTPNAWAPLTADEELGLVYAPLGNPAPDHLGSHRRSFDERYGTSLVALDARDGRLRWSFQAVHHDLWDYDLPAQPSLADVGVGSGQRKAIILPSKEGDIFVLDRQSGRPIVPVREVRVPGGTVPGDRSSPTQPRSAINLAKPPIAEREMWGLSPLDQLWCRIRFREARYAGAFTPPATRPTINNPGFFGVMNWGGVSIDPRRQVMSVNSSNMPFLIRLLPTERRHANALRNHDSGVTATRGAAYGVAFEPFLGPLGVPCTQPPWGELRSIDLASGRTLWQRSVGTTRDNGLMGLRIPVPIPVGTPQIGGTIVTAGRLIFSAGTTDDYLRAYDLATGRELWRGRLPAGGQATPMTYATGGRQYVVVTVGGHPPLGTRRGDYLMAFALPRGIVR